MRLSSTFWLRDFLFSKCVCSEADGWTQFRSVQGSLKVSDSGGRTQIDSVIFANCKFLVSNRRHPQQSPAKFFCKYFINKIFRTEVAPGSKAGLGVPQGSVIVPYSNFLIWKPLVLRKPHNYYYLVGQLRVISFLFSKL